MNARKAAWALTIVATAAMSFTTASATPTPWLISTSTTQFAVPDSGTIHLFHEATYVTDGSLEIAPFRSFLPSDLGLDAVHVLTGDEGEGLAFSVDEVRHVFNDGRTIQLFPGRVYHFDPCGRIEPYAPLIGFTVDNIDALATIDGELDGTTAEIGWLFSTQDLEWFVQPDGSLLRLYPSSVYCFDYLTGFVIRFANLARAGITNVDALQFGDGMLLVSSTGNDFVKVLGGGRRRSRNEDVLVYDPDARRFDRTPLFDGSRVDLNDLDAFSLQLLICKCEE